jgi:uncharacterized protein (AIM24 family)
MYEPISITELDAISSGGSLPSGITSGLFTNLGARIENKSGYDRLRFVLEPGASVITNQDTMSYMDGGLTTGASMRSGIFNGILRSLTGSSILQNTVTNSTPNRLRLVLSPLLQGSIIQVNIKAGETWRFADRCFLACTPNIGVSGNINIFSNFRLLFAGQDLTYTTVTAKDSDGIVWITAHGSCEMHELPMGQGATPLYINHGCFLGMLDKSDGIDYWKDYVTVGTANSLFSAIFTQLGILMKIQDTKVPNRPTRCIVLTQTLNPKNLEKFVQRIAERVAESVMARRSLAGGSRQKTRKRQS